MCQRLCNKWFPCWGAGATSFPTLFAQPAIEGKRAEGSATGCSAVNLQLETSGWLFYAQRAAWVSLPEHTNALWRCVHCGRQRALDAASEAIAIGPKSGFASNDKLYGIHGRQVNKPAERPVWWHAANASSIAHQTGSWWTHAIHVLQRQVVPLECAGCSRRASGYGYR